MTDKNTLHKNRVNQAINFQKPDRTPKDFLAVPQVWEKLGDYFNTRDCKVILRKLGVDCRIVYYDNFCQHPNIENSTVDFEASMERSSLSGMWRKIEPDGSNNDIWGAHRKKVKTPFGEVDEFMSYPLKSAQSIDDLKNYQWPQPDWWDFSNLNSHIDDLNDIEEYNIRYRLGSFFETAWSLYGFDKFLLDLMMNPGMCRYVMDRIAEVHFENLRKVLDRAGDKIDIVYFYDDVASQQNLLISPQMYKNFIQPYHQKVIDIASKYNKPTMMHCCGAVFPLIDRFIDMGIKILNPIQPTAKDMGPEKLSEKYGGRIWFHGGIDIQHFLPKAIPEQVKEKVDYTSKILGAKGGYIMAGSHHIQADIPVNNILAMYGVI